jgi:hypothetical protein
MTLLRTRAVMIGAGAVLILGTGSTAAYAALAGSPVDASGVIHGCWTNAAINGTHVFVLQDAGTTCPKGTTAIEWNQQGPAGPAGPAGAAGPQGPPGATGPQGPAGNTGPAGGTGPAGPQGPAGADGNTILSGTAAPDNSVGNDGDFYIDTAADMLYGPKAGGTWPAAGTSHVGPAGPTGDTGPAGAAGPAGPAGPPGATGPAGPGGASTLDALNGTTCNAGSPSQGALSVSYGSQGSVTLTCVPTQLYTLTVSVASGDGNDSIVSSPAGIDCGPSVANSVCSAQFPTGYTVTLTGQADVNGDVLDGWSGGGCPARINITHPYNQTGQPGLASTLNNTCAVTMSADTTVSASFAGVMRVQNVANDNVNFVPDPGGAECPSSGPDCKGTLLNSGNPDVTDVIPYGTTVNVTDQGGNGVTFMGNACTAAFGATVTATECDFTMVPGDALVVELPALTISGG